MIEKAVAICSGERRRYSISECVTLADVVLSMAGELRALRAEFDSFRADCSERLRAPNGSGIAEPGQSDSDADGFKSREVHQSVRVGRSPGGSERASGDSSEDCD